MPTKWTKKLDFNGKFKIVIFYQQAGEVYFITDGNPVNSFEFLRPLIEGLGYPYPRITLPYTLMYFICKYCV